MAIIDDKLNVTEAELNKISDVYSKGQAKIERLLIDNINQPLNAAKKDSIMARIREIATDMSVQTKQWLGITIPETYKVGLRFTDKSLKSLPNAKSIRELPLATHVEAVNSIISGASDKFDLSLTTMQRSAGTLLTDALQRQVTERLAAVRGESIDTISKDIATRIRADGITGLVNKAGAQIKVEDYARMLARTEVLNSANEGIVNRSRQYGVDIVKVSEHAGVDPDDELCFELQGKFFSLSGKSENYPELPEQPPFHPNCRHILQPQPDLE